MIISQSFIVAFGLIVGSFLNVCIHRIPRRESVVRPRSRCPACGHAIRGWENIPILSFLLLRGRCSRCGRRISGVYPLVEALTAITFLLLFRKYGFSPALVVNMILCAQIIALIFIDLFERLLPNPITFSGMAAGFLLSPFQSPEFYGATSAAPGAPYWWHLAGSLLGLVIGGGFLWVVAVGYRKIRKIEGMGFGDIKLMAMVGAYLGWRYAWLTILLGSLMGALVGSTYIVAAGKGKRYELPFGSFLGAAAIGVVLWGQALVSWYLP